MTSKIGRFLAAAFNWKAALIVGSFFGLLATFLYIQFWALGQRDAVVVQEQIEVTDSLIAGQDSVLAGTCGEIADRLTDARLENQILIRQVGELRIAIARLGGTSADIQAAQRELQLEVLRQQQAKYQTDSLKAPTEKETSKRKRRKKDLLDKMEEEVDRLPAEDTTKPKRKNE